MRTKKLFKWSLILCVLFFMWGCLQKNPREKKHSEPSVSLDTTSFDKFQGKFISQKRINDTTYEIKAKVNDTAKTMVFFSEIPVNEELLNQYDSGTLILEYLKERDSIINKTVLRVKSVEISSISYK